MKKILFLVASMLIGITMQLTAQQNGVAVVPIPSSEANPIYYFIESAYNGTTGAKPTTGTSSQGNVIYSQTTDDQNAKHDAVGSITNVYDVGLWRLTASGSNYIIKNKTYGYLKTSVSPTIVDLQATTITNTLTRYVNAYQYNMKSWSQNPVVAWHTDARGNYLDRYSDQGVNSRSAWYFVLPKDNIDIAIANANGYMNNTTAGNDVGQYSAKTRILLQSAIDVATANKNDGDDTNNADAANVLNSEIVKYYNAKNLVKIETPALIINKATDARLDLALKFTVSGSVPNSVKVGTGNAIIWKLAKSTTSYNGHAIVCNVSGTDYYVQANLTLGTTLYEKWVIEEKTYSGVTGVRFALYEGTGGALSAVLHQSNNGPNYAVMNYTGDDMASLWKVDNGRDLLGTTLTKTNAIINSTIESDEFGQLTTAKRTNLVSAKDAATTVYINTTLTASDYYPSFVTLNNALTNNPVNTDKNAFTSADENKYKWYSIRSTGTATYVANKVISSNGRVLTNKFTFENAGTPVTDAQLFRFEISGSEIIIINKANGYYMATDGAISSTSATFALNLLTDGYSFNIKPASANAIHAQEAGSTIVNWAGDAGSASAWVFDYQKTTPKVPEFSGTGNWSAAANWVDNALPNTYNDVIINGAGEAVLDVDASYNSITINSGKSLSVAPGKGLTIGGTLINNGTLTLQSDATGTATILSPATITSGTGAVYNVQQYLTGNADNSARQWWYVSSPVSSAKSSVFDPAGTNNMGYYDETLATPAFVQFTANDQDLMVGTGYVTQLKSTGTFTFTGGTLNNGDITLTPTRTGIDAAKRGFNLVGNPYPSYLNWDAAYTDTQNPQSNMRNAIWYRTYSGGAMVFHTYANEESVPLGANGMIPPMQAFWVKVKADGSNGSITFKNAYRSHATGSTFPLKAKAMTKTQRLRLLVSNGTNTDETLIVGKSYASAAYDEYDTEKMSNNNAAIPEIYSIAESQELVINSVNQLAEGETIPLGLRPGQAGSFSIEATQLDNIDAQVVLVDKLTGAKTELTAGISYNFISDGTATNNRFSIEFRAPGMTTGLDNSDFTDFNITVYSGKIQIQSPAMANGELIRVYSSNGQKIIEQTAEGNNTIIDHKLSSGVYFVKVSNYVQKIIIQ
ncbi:MAG: T9SS type A sorting domain-containing protein [Bacteroidia bacterium]|nr:T9SS type A sorting domain-containing protein [Bacteroidia bacterium]